MQRTISGATSSSGIAADGAEPDGCTPAELQALFERDMKLSELVQARTSRAPVGQRDFFSAGLTLSMSAWTWRAAALVDDLASGDGAGIGAAGCASATSSHFMLCTPSPSTTVMPEARLLYTTTSIVCPVEVTRTVIFSMFTVR